MRLPAGTTGIIGNVGLVNGGEIIASDDEIAQLVRALEAAIARAPVLEPVQDPHPFIEDVA